MKFNKEFNRDTAYWNDFYKKNPPASMQESRFARFVAKYVEKGRTLVDIGCGNGRDSFFFGRLGLSVVGIDASDEIISSLSRVASAGHSFVCGNFINEKTVYDNRADYFYSRFSLHAINEDGQNELIKNVYGSLSEGGKFFIEVRCVRDSKYGKGEEVEPNAFILDGHYRRFIVMEDLLSELIKAGFHIKYAEQEKGFAPFNGDDSEIIRIVAVKRGGIQTAWGGVRKYSKIHSFRRQLVVGRVA